MTEFSYAKGRISESLQFIGREMQEFDIEYANRNWQDYQQDLKLQKLMDRTVENILTALIEICGTILAEKSVAAENYSEVLARAAKEFGFSKEEADGLAKLAIHRNRLAHRYLDFKWQAIKAYMEHRTVIKRLLQKMLEKEKQ